MATILEEDDIKYKKLDQLSYYDNGNDDVELFVNDDFIGTIEVFTDRENENREYICINYTVVYLDTIKKIK